MALYARVENGVVVERREITDPIPETKAHLWRLIVDPGPPAVAAGEVAAVSEAESGDTWQVSYTVNKLPDAELRARIKAEAQRRIIALTGASDFNSCMTKQLNAVMRATELTNKKASGGTLTDAENAEAAALAGLATAIKAIRSKSDALEVSLPADYTNDSHW